MVRNWMGTKTHIWQASCPVIKAKSWDELLTVLNQKQRSNTRRALRRATEDGIRRVLAGADDAEVAARRLTALHRQSWQGRDISPEHLTERFDCLLQAAARRMTASGNGVISEFWHDQR
jgi:predicted N-acyltransferase